MKELMVNIYLFWGTWQDIREKKISDFYLLVGIIGGIFFCGLNIWTGSFSFGTWGLAWIPGILFLLISKVRKEKIGMGDGLLLLVLSSFFSIRELWLMIGTAFILLMPVSVLLLCSRKVSINYQIPFLPFLWLAHTLLWGLNYV